MNKSKPPNPNKIYSTTLGITKIAFAFKTSATMPKIIRINHMIFSSYKILSVLFTRFTWYLGLNSSNACAVASSNPGMIDIQSSRI